MKFLKYSAISLLGLVVASIIFYLLHSFLDINAYYSNLIGDGIALLMVFLYSWYFIFDHSRKGFKRKLIFNTIEGLPPKSQEKDYNPSIKSNDVILNNSDDISLPNSLLGPYLMPDTIEKKNFYNFLILLVVIQILVYLFFK